MVLNTDRTPSAEDYGGVQKRYCELRIEDDCGIHAEGQEPASVMDTGRRLARRWAQDREIFLWAPFTQVPRDATGGRGILTNK